MSSGIKTNPRLEPVYRYTNIFVLISIILSFGTLAASIFIIGNWYTFLSITILIAGLVNGMMKDSLMFFVIGVLLANCIQLLPHNSLHSYGLFYYFQLAAATSSGMVVLIGLIIDRLNPNFHGIPEG